MEINQLQVELSAKISPLQKELKKVSKQLSGLDKETSNLSKSMNRSFSGTLGSIKKTTAGIAAASYAAIKAVRAMGEAAVDAIKVDAQADNLTRSMGKGSEAFLQWAHDGAAAFGIAEAAAIKYGNTYSGIVAQFETDGARVAGITRNLIETAAVVASKSGRTTDDVLERIRSGLSGNVGAIEDLGIYVNQKTIEMSNAFMRIADGTPWSQLSMAQQSQIRTFAILEQAQRKYGTTVAETSAPLYLLKANLANLSLAWGRAFAPIAQFVIPLLNGLVMTLMTVANVIQKFTEKIFGVKKRAKETEKINFSGMGSGMSEAADSAGTMGSNLGKANKQAKQLQRTLFGFDVIHNIEEPVEPADAGGGGVGGIGGGMGGGSFEMPDFTASAESAGLFAEQIDKAQEMADKISSKLNKLIPILAGVAAGFLAFKFLNKIASGDGAFNAILGFTSKLPKFLGFLEPILLGIGGAIDGFIMMLSTLGATLMQVVAPAGAVVAEGTAALLVGFAAFAIIVGATIGAIVDLWKHNDGFRDSVMNAMNSIKSTLKSLNDNIIQPILTSIKEMLLIVWEYGVKPLWEGWKEMVRIIIEALMELIAEFQPFAQWMIQTFGPVLTTLFDALSKSFGMAIAVMLQAFGGFFKNMGILIEAVVGIFKGLMKFITGIFMGDWKCAWSGVVDIFSNLFGVIPKIFKNVWNTIVGLVGQGGMIFKNFAGAVAQVFKSIVNAMIGGINAVISAPFRALRGMLSDIAGVKVMGMKPFGWINPNIIPIPNIPQFATGGFPEDGLFFANSNELVGKFTNGKTAVANNGQIIQGVSQGVAQAVSQVLGTQRSNGTQPINLTVQIGSETIAKETIKAIDDYTMRTGQTFKTV